MNTVIRYLIATGIVVAGFGVVIIVAYFMMKYPLVPLGLLVTAVIVFFIWVVAQFIQALS